MSLKFPISKLALALLTLSAASVSQGAGLDRSGQDISAFLQDGTYAEVVYTYIDADVTGHDNAYVGPSQTNFTKGQAIDDIAEDYDFARYGVKTDINDTFSVGVIYDESYGAEAAYSGDNNFVASGDLNAALSSVTGGTLNDFQQAKGQFDALLGAKMSGATLTPQQEAQLQGLGQALAAAGLDGQFAGEETEVSVRSYNLSAILGMKLANSGLQIYGGPVAQRAEGEVKLRGIAYGGANGYTAVMAPDIDYGWLAGLSYSKPEIALKAALTYRSEIEHTLEADESFPIVGLNNMGSDVDVTTPESYNLDFQTGINPTTLVTAKVRYVPWADFAIVPPVYNQVSGQPLVDYSDDQWSAELGLAKRLSPAVAVSGSIGWDSGAGNPTSSLGPVEGYYSVGAGAKFNVTENWAISAGGKYLMFGDAKGSLPTGKIVANFEDNDGYVLGVKISYQDK